MYFAPVLRSRFDFLYPVRAAPSRKRRASSDRCLAVTGLISSFATIWRLAAPYFCSEDRWGRAVLLAAVVALELSLVGITVLLTYWNTLLQRAAGSRPGRFVSELLFFCVLADAVHRLAVYKLYLNQWLQIRWRRWMTGNTSATGSTARPTTACSCSATPPTIPTSASPKTSSCSSRRTLIIGIGLLSSMVTLGSFVVILWALSTAPCTLFGVERDPGLSGLGGADLRDRRHRVHASDRLAAGAAQFHQQRYEADFRFNLVRVRENSEQIALLAARRRRPTAARPLRPRDRELRGSCRRTKRLTSSPPATAGLDVFPYVVVTPAYFSGTSSSAG